MTSITDSERTVVIASENPVKTQSALNGMRRMFPSETFRGEGVAVPSEVSAQPMSDGETLRGACARAQSARRNVPNADFWVGIEAGCDRIEGSLHMFAWAVVISADRIGQARTASLPLPTEVTELVALGVELGVATDRVFDRLNSKRASGAVGILTHEVIDRTAFLEHAVVLALVPFVNPGLHFR
jgi:inosine/xanthosine triphosphatase